MIVFVCDATQQDSQIRAEPLACCGKANEKKIYEHPLLDLESNIQVAGSLRPVNAQRFWQRRSEAPTLQAGLSKDRHPWLHWVKNPNPQCHFPLILLLLLHQKVRLVQDLSYKFSWNQNKILFLPFSLSFFFLCHVRLASCFHCLPSDLIKLFSDKLPTRTGTPSRFRKLYSLS